MKVLKNKKVPVARVEAGHGRFAHRHEKDGSITLLFARANKRVVPGIQHTPIDFESEEWTPVLWINIPTVESARGWAGELADIVAHMEDAQ